MISRNTGIAVGNSGDVLGQHDRLSVPAGGQHRDHVGRVETIVQQHSVGRPSHCARWPQHLRVRARAAARRDLRSVMFQAPIGSDAPQPELRSGAARIAGSKPGDLRPLSLQFARQPAGNDLDASAMARSRRTRSTPACHGPPSAPPSSNFVGKRGWSAAGLDRGRQNRAGRGPNVICVVAVDDRNQETAKNVLRAYHHQRGSEHGRRERSI